MSTLHSAILEQNAKHVNEGGTLVEIVILKNKNVFTGDNSLKINVCCNGQGKCLDKGFQMFQGTSFPSLE